MKMLALVVVITCVTVPLTAHLLPPVSVGRHDGGLLFTMAHSPGLREVYFNYLLERLMGYNTRMGKAEREGDYWYMKDKGLNLSPGDRIQYNVWAWGPFGKLHGPPCAWTYEPTNNFGPWRMRPVLFREDFNGDRLDRNDWKYEVSMFGGLNWEFQVYTNQEENVFVQGGHLFLKPTLTLDDPKFGGDYLTTGVMDATEIWGVCTNSGNNGCKREGKYGLLPPVMSGKVTTRPTLRYGTVEVRARIPKGDWIWPAIWMLPKSNKYGIWPRSGEIDIMESRGNVRAMSDDGQNHGINEVSSTLHWGTAWNDNYYTLTHQEKRKKSGDWHSDFHTWRLDWTPDYLATYVDEEEVLRVTPPAEGFYTYGNMTGDNLWASGTKMAPFDEEFFLILNVAVGGTVGFFPDDYDYGRQKPWLNTSPQASADFWAQRNAWHKTWLGNSVAMEIDYVEFRHL